MRCALCHQEINSNQQIYTMRLDLFAAAEDLQISAEELGQNRADEIKQLLERLKDMDAEQIEEESDRIFERHTYTLCAICRAELHNLLRGTPLSEQTH